MLIDKQGGLFHQCGWFCCSKVGGFELKVNLFPYVSLYVGVYLSLSIYIYRQSEIYVSRAFDFAPYLNHSPQDERVSVPLVVGVCVFLCKFYTGMRKYSINE